MARRPGGAQRYNLGSSALKLDRQRYNEADFSPFVAVVFLLRATIKPRETGRTMTNGRS